MPDPVVSPAAKPVAAKQPDAAPVATTLKTFTVANGRTVHGEDEPIGPGGSIDLDPKEGKRLQKLGFLLNDEGDLVLDEKAGPVVIQGAEITEK